MDVDDYEVIGTLDKGMCDFCGEMDGKVFPVNKMQAGSTAPPFHPWCRCTTAPWYEDMVGVGQRFARDKDGKTYAVASDMTYAEWKQKFVDNSAESGIINKKISDRMINLFNETENGLFDFEEIQKEMLTSSVGREIARIIDDDYYTIYMSYDVDAPSDLMGDIIGNEITIYAVNHSSPTEVVETIIHEVSHRKYSWDDTQEDEINCRLMEYFHTHEEISDEKITEIVRFVNKEYSYFPKGDLYGY